MTKEFSGSSVAVSVTVALFTTGRKATFRFQLYYITRRALCLYQIVNIFCTIVNFFIDNSIRRGYNENMGYHVKPLSTPINVSGVVNVHFFEFPQNFFPRNEKHPFCELVFVSSGVLYISSENYSGALKKNQMLIHKPMERHSLVCDEKSLPTAIIIDFACDAEKLADFSQKAISLNDASVKKLAQIVKEGRNVFAPPYNRPYGDMVKKAQQPFGAEELLKNLLENFLIELIREFSFLQIEQDAADPVRPLQDEIVAYIDENFLEKITIDELAFLFNTNRSTLCREFKKITGKTIGGYIADKKLDLAKKKLASSDKNFTEIAEELCFESIHYFTRFFKKATGLSPSKYRQEFLKKSL